MNRLINNQKETNGSKKQKMKQKTDDYETWMNADDIVELNVPKLDLMFMEKIN